MSDPTGQSDPAPRKGDNKPTRPVADCGRFRVQPGPKGEAPLNTLVLGRRFVFSS